jgi:hypothetical protein
MSTSYESLYWRVQEAIADPLVSTEDLKAMKTELEHALAEVEADLETMEGVTA